MRHVIVRGPLALAAMVGILWVSIMTLDDKADRRAGLTREWQELQAREAPLIAGQIAYSQVELWRRERRLASDPAEFGHPDALSRGHDLALELTGEHYVVTVDGFRLAVDYASGLVEPTCSAPERLGCRDGRWDFRELAGFEPRLLLP